MFIQKHLKSVILAIIISITLYLASTIMLGWQDSINLIKKISVTGWLSLIFCSLSSYLIRYARWSYFIKQLGYIIPHQQHFLYYVSAFALTVTPAKLGETIRSLYLFNHGVSYSKSISAFFIERLLDLFVVTLLSSLLLIHNTEYGVVIFSLTLLLIVTLISLKTKTAHLIFIQFTNTLKSKKLIKILNNLISILEHSKQLLKYKSLLPGFILGCCAWTIQGTAFYLLLDQLDVNIPIYIAISIYSIALISGALSFIPGGIGSTEIVMGLFLYYFGAPKEVVVIAPIIIRITSLWFAVLVGLISTIILTNKLTKS